MEKKVLLINLPSDTIRKPEEHCEIAFLSAYLLSMNIAVDILDAYAELKDLTYCKKYIRNWLKQNSANELYIGISPFVTSYNYFVELTNFIKKCDEKCYLFAGGHFASLNKEYLLEKHKNLDAIIVGEGEISLYELITNAKETNIRGIYKREFIKDFKSRERIVNLDQLPFQTRYLTLQQLEGQPFSITTSRGCYGECSFCGISSFYKTNTYNLKQTYRSAKSVSKEIHELVKKYHINNLKIVDDNFFRNNSNTFLIELIELLSDLNISFRISARPNDITQERAVLLKKMGVAVVAIGVESANEESLQLFNKGIKVESSERAIEHLKNNQITCLANFIMFDPIIDIDGISENCKFVERHIEDSIFHRINSHLWIRATDPVADNLVEQGICQKRGFPYIQCRYKSKDTVKIKKYFDRWCYHNMKTYYANADILMARGIDNNVEAYQNYKKMIRKDVEILRKLIKFSRQESLEHIGQSYIQKCIIEDK